MLSPAAAPAAAPTSPQSAASTWSPGPSPVHSASPPPQPVRYDPAQVVRVRVWDGEKQEWVDRDPASYTSGQLSGTISAQTSQYARPGQAEAPRPGTIVSSRILTKEEAEEYYRKRDAEKAAEPQDAAVSPGVQVGDAPPPAAVAPVAAPPAAASPAAAPAADRAAREPAPAAARDVSPAPMPAPASTTAADGQPVDIIAMVDSGMAEYHAALLKSQGLDWSWAKPCWTVLFGVSKALPEEAAAEDVRSRVTMHFESLGVGIRAIPCLDCRAHYVQMFNAKFPRGDEFKRATVLAWVTELKAEVDVMVKQKMELMRIWEEQQRQLGARGGYMYAGYQQQPAAYYPQTTYQPQTAHQTQTAYHPQTEHRPQTAAPAYSSGSIQQPVAAPRYVPSPGAATGNGPPPGAQMPRDYDPSTWKYVGTGPPCPNCAPKPGTVA